MDIHQPLRAAAAPLAYGLSTLLACATVSARPDDTGCGPARAAIAALASRERVQVLAAVTQGHHPDGHRLADSRLIGRWQWLYVDGRLNASGPARPEDGTRALANGVAQLAPPEDCESLGERRQDGRPLVGHRFSVPVEVGLNRIDLWVDGASGLPVAADVVGPEWVMGRVLSRPGTPPQVRPRKNGRRYAEQLRFRYDAEVPDPRGATAAPG